MDVTDPMRVGAENLIGSREGLKRVVYRDTRNRLTGWIGHLVQPEDCMRFGDNIPDAIGQAWWAKDSAKAFAATAAQMDEAGITSEAFFPYLASVNYQLGTEWTKEFPNTWAMIVRGDYLDAAFAVGNTRWDMETPVRVADFQKALRALPPKPKQDPMVAGA